MYLPTDCDRMVMNERIKKVSCEKRVQFTRFFPKCQTFIRNKCSAFMTRINYNGNTGKVRVVVILTVDRFSKVLAMHRCNRSQLTSRHLPDIYIEKWLRTRGFVFVWRQTGRNEKHWLSRFQHEEKMMGQKTRKNMRTKFHKIGILPTFTYFLEM